MHSIQSCRIRVPRVHNHLASYSDYFRRGPRQSNPLAGTAGVVTGLLIWRLVEVPALRLRHLLERRSRRMQGDPAKPLRAAERRR